MLAREPENNSVHEQLGKVYWDAGDHGRAIEHLTAACELCPDKAGTLLNLTLRLNQLGMMNRGRAHFREYIKRNPGDRETQRRWHEINDRFDKATVELIQPDVAEKLFTGKGRPENLRLMTFEEYLELEVAIPQYYIGRWQYYRQILDLLSRLTFNSVLELGPYHKPIITGADTMDFNSKLPGITYYHNGAQVPWPISGKVYDLFIGMQVWEHLKGGQRDTFGEVMRTSKMALLSFPLNWNCPENPVHHHITREQIACWTLETTPVLTITVSARLIALYLFS